MDTRDTRRPGAYENPTLDVVRLGADIVRTSDNDGAYAASQLLDFDEEELSR